MGKIKLTGGGRMKGEKRTERRNLQIELIKIAGPVLQHQACY
jgi:hypothetical protein